MISRKVLHKGPAFLLPINTWKNRLNSNVAYLYVQNCMTTLLSTIISKCVVIRITLDHMDDGPERQEIYH